MRRAPASRQRKGCLLLQTMRIASRAGPPILNLGDKSAGMATEPPQVGDMVTFRVGGLPVIDLAVEAIGDVMMKGELAGFQGHFPNAFPRTFDRGNKLEVETAAAFILRRIEEYVRS